VAALLRSIDARPLPGRGSRELTESLAVLGIAYPLYSTAEQGYPRLRAALAAALDGNGGELMTLSDGYTRRRPDGTYADNGNEVIYAVNCLDREDVQSPAQLRTRLPAFGRASPTFGDYLAWSGLPCTTWPVPPQGRPGAVRGEGAPPVLVVGTTGDPATPYRWAVDVAAALESGMLLTYEGAVHTAYTQGSECVDAAVDGYLLDGTPPPDGLRCS
jgi:hypothetical protein